MISKNLPKSLASISTFPKTHWLLMFISLLLSSALLSSVYSAYLTRQVFDHLQVQWQQNNNVAIQKLLHLDNLQSHIGYGAFIHHFKNALLRKDMAHLQRAWHDYQKVLQDIEQYHQLPINDKEKLWLKHISDTINQYADKLPLLRQGIQENWPIEKIDSLIKVDDFLAIEALAQLQDAANAEYQRSNQAILQQLEAFQRQQQTFNLSSIIFVLGTALAMLVIVYLIRKAQALFSYNKAQNDLYQTTINSIGDAFIIINKAGIIQAVNQPTTQLLGYDAEELIGENIKILIPEGMHRNQHDDYLKQATGKFKRILNKDRMLFSQHKDGHLIPSEISVSTLNLDNETQFLGVIRDISERFELMQRLASEEQLYRNTFELAAVGIAHIGLDGHWLRVNQALENILGYDGASLQSITLQQVVHPEDVSLDQRERLKLLSDELDKYTLDLRFIHRDGRTLWAEFCVALARDIQHQPLYFIAVLEDISLRKNMTERLKHMASKDFLSGLYNRRTFMQEAARELAHSIQNYQCMSLILLDIDHFKSINDEYGHQIGDEAIKHIAKHLSQSARNVDILARFGGEEFIVVLGNTQESEAAEIAERMRLRLCNNTLNTDDMTLSVTASFGVSCSNHSITSLEQLISQADKSMYQAKIRGRNRVVRFSELTL